jgi:hypothetical protein
VNHAHSRQPGQEGPVDKLFDLAGCFVDGAPDQRVALLLVTVGPVSDVPRPIPGRRSRARIA